VLAMMHVEDSARRRFALLGGVVFLVLGGMMLVGVVQRFVPSPLRAAEDGFDSEAVIAEARRARTLRNELARLGKTGQWSEVIRVADVSLKEQEAGLIRGLRAEAVLLSGDWEQGRHEYRDLLGTEEPVIRATRLQFEEDANGYRKHCERWITPIDVSRIPVQNANNAAWMCALGPDALSDFTKVRQLAEKAVAGASVDEKPNHLNTLGAVLYRMGEDKAAIEQLTESDRLNENPFNWAFLALAQQRLGNKDEALRWKRRLQDRIRETFATTALQESRHELLILLHEVEKQIKQ
jgi:tetratricopeptide (TPR) repeat protein